MEISDALKKIMFVIFFIFLSLANEKISCGVVYFPHIPRCGGTSLVQFFKSTLQIGPENVYDFDFFSSLEFDGDHRLSQQEFEKLRDKPETKFHWMKQVDEIESRVHNFENKQSNWLLIHQHAFTPGLISTMENITRWRIQIEDRGCKFLLVTLLRSPLKRGISHLRYFGFDEERYVTNQLRSGSNYQIKFLLFGECNMTSIPLECAAKGVPTPRPDDLKTLLRLLKNFDLIGSMENLPDFLQKFSELSGKPSAKMPEHRTSANVNFTGLTLEQETIIREYGIELDQYLYDVIISEKVLPGGFSDNTVYADLMCYLDRYSGLRPAYCTPHCDFKGIYLHWHQHGRFENKVFYCNTPSEKDVKCYSKQYPESLQEFCNGGKEQCTDAQIVDHWHLIGKQKGMKMRCEDLTDKLECNAILLPPDLFDQYCSGTYAKYKCRIAQIREKLDESHLLDCKYIDRYRSHFCYANRYQHLLDGYCDGQLRNCDVQRLEKHWTNSGKEEKMAFGCIDEDLLIHLQCFAEYHRKGEIMQKYCDGTIFNCDWEEVYKRYTKEGFGKVIGKEDFSCEVTTSPMKPYYETIALNEGDLVISQQIHESALLLAALPSLIVLMLLRYGSTSCFKLGSKEN